MFSKFSLGQQRFCQAPRGLQRPATLTPTVKSPTYTGGSISMKSGRTLSWHEGKGSSSLCCQQDWAWPGRGSNPHPPSLRTDTRLLGQWAGLWSGWNRWFGGGQSRCIWYQPTKKWLSTLMTKWTGWQSHCLFLFFLLVYSLVVIWTVIWKTWINIIDFCKIKKSLQTTN